MAEIRHPALMTIGDKMTLISDILDMKLLEEMVSSGYVTVRLHDDRPWAILNYSSKAQYDAKWNDVTEQCRGLVYDTETLEVIARPFRKFHNWDQGRAPIPTGPVIRMDKADGSLAILCASPFEDVPIDEWIATRGSFHSEQAVWANKFYMQELNRQIHEDPDPFLPVAGKTYLWEIVYPENRIVKDYKGYSGLILIDVIDIATGRSDLQEFDDCRWPDKVERIFIGKGFDATQVNDIAPGDEGFVFLWPEKNYRLKMKSAEYIELHRLVTNLSEKTVWQMLVDGKSIAEINDELPDEFHQFVIDTASAMQKKANNVALKVMEETEKMIRKLGPDASRKDYALYIKDNPLKAYIFATLDSKPVLPLVWASLKPKHEPVNRSDGE